MARILYSAISNIPVKNALNGPFHEGLVNALVREGNDVLVMTGNHFFRSHYYSNKLKSEIDRQKLNEEIISFNPDIVFSFNNSLHRDIPKLLDCPIAIWAADSAPTFVDKGKLKENIDRYDILHFTDNAALYSAIDYYGSKKNKNHVIGYATDLQNEKLDKNVTISFIGTHFEGIGNIISFLKRYYKNASIIEDFKKLLTLSIENPLIKPVEYCKKYTLNSLLYKKIKHVDMLCLISCSERIKQLSAISDLGLKIYGSNTWYNAIFADMNFILNYEPGLFYTVKHNQDIYNSSKIAINISHAQSRHDNLPWRVPDIMASDAVLLSDYKTIYKDMFGLDIPMYKDAYEARELSKKLLVEDNWRQDLVAASNEAIENGYRFKHMFKKLEHIFGIKLLNDKKGKLEHLNEREFNYLKYRIKNNFLDITKPITEYISSTLLDQILALPPDVRFSLIDWTPPVIYRHFLEMHKKGMYKNVR